MSKYGNPHEHAEYLRSLPETARVLMVTPDDRFFLVMESDPTWAYLVPWQGDQTMPYTSAYWLRWEDISENGIRFETRRRAY